ncbi:MAG: DUF4252 domain-containing protein [Bacteroidales bacterium]
MKRTVLFMMIVLTVAMTANAQRSPIDDLFEKYSGKDGITTVYISGRMLKLFSDLSQEEQEVNDLVGRLTAIRILSIDDPVINKTVNLYNELGGSNYFRDYEELMVIREGADIVKFMIKESGNRISELIMVSGGESNALISIRGDIDLKSISALSKSMGIEQLENLEKIDRKQDIKK